MYVCKQGVVNTRLVVKIFAQCEQEKPLCVAINSWRHKLFECFINILKKMAKFAYAVYCAVEI